MPITTRPDIVLLHQHFRWAAGGGPARTYYIAEALVNAGFNLVVISGPDGIVPEEEQSKFKILRVGIPYKASMKVYARIWSFIYFAFAAWWTIIRLRPKLIYASSTPLTVGLVALCAFRKFVFEVRDLWPEAPIELGALKHPLLIRLAKWMAISSYKAAEAVVVLSPMMVKSVLPYNNRVVVVPNFATPIQYQGVGKVIAKRIALAKTENRYTLFYGGAIGPANGVEKIIRLAYLLGPTQWHITLAPETHRSIPVALQKCIDTGLITLIPYMDSQNLNLYLSGVYAVLVSFDDYPSLQATSPNKWFLALAQALPTIMACSGWHTDLVLANNSGGYYSHETEEKFLKSLMEIQDPNNYTEMAMAAHRLSQQFTTDNATAEITQLVEGLVSQKQ